MSKAEGYVRLGARDWKIDKMHNIKIEDAWIIFDYGSDMKNISCSLHTLVALEELKYLFSNIKFIQFLEIQQIGN